MTLGGKAFIPDNVKMTKAELYAKYKPVDPIQIITQIKQITESAKELNDFEIDFLKELGRQASVFKGELRMSPKRIQTLEGIWATHALPKILDGLKK